VIDGYKILETKDWDVAMKMAQTENQSKQDLVSFWIIGSIQCFKGLIFLNQR